MKEQKNKELEELKELASEIVNLEWRTVDTVETHIRNKTYNCAPDCSPQCGPACAPTDPGCTPRTGCNPIKQDSRNCVSIQNKLKSRGPDELCTPDVSCSPPPQCNPDSCPPDM